MIVGNGLLAKKLMKFDKNNFCFFASGVSNSNETSQFQFDRERKLLLEVLRDIETKENITIVYFSSCGIEFESSPYFSHKQLMESLIKKHSKKYYIFRLPQVVGSLGNSNTLFKYLEKSISNNEKIKVWKYAKRNLIDIEDVVKATNLIIVNDCHINQTVNIATPYNLSIVSILQYVEKKFNISVDYQLIDKGEPVDIDIKEINSIVDVEDFFYGGESEYMNNLIGKYMQLKEG